MNKNLKTILLFAILSMISFIIISCPISITDAQIKQLQIKQAIHAKLFGNKEVPPVTTSATGIAQFNIIPGSKTLNYDLIVPNIHTFTTAYIYQGKPHENEHPIVKLSKGSGSITSSNLIGPMKGKQISDLVKLIENGQTYVNVNSQKYKNGEIRGQIRVVQHE